MSNMATVQAATTAQQIFGLIDPLLDKWWIQMMQQYTGLLAQTNQTFHQKEDHQDFHFQKGDFWWEHQVVVMGSQEVKVHLEQDYPMQNLEEEETLNKDQTSWWEIYLKCSREYEQKLSTSLLNGSFMLC